MSRSGFGYFLYGMELTTKPGIRHFVLLPLLANIVIVGMALYLLFSNLGTWIDSWLAYLPQWLIWLEYVLWPLLVITIVGLFSYFFSTLANFIAAPLNGLLAEKVENYLTGRQDNSTVLDVIKDLPRVFKREWQKLWYTTPKAIGLFLLMLIPALGQTVAPVLWFLFTAWMLAVQYCDYPFDNHKVPFATMRQELKQNQGSAYSFGGLVSLFTTIPLLNLVVMPIAVCGATAMWVDKYQHTSALPR
ncbi:cysteine biosynthesis protein CysZ [Vibrio sp. qd031]|uniref:sulfate transporter CysZ n=1 Tax=Vibrio sp. qd031 TaxID=1603038 RepID=UPI000A10AEAD|nr:sulfate transporter CysZ [Vibrio sp. qd031]ORT50425.1 cysteine biosynthesis protein CysZ [Vibrio sp. qd031]